MIKKVREIKDPSISSEEEINYTLEVEEVNKKNEDISLGDTSSKLQGEEVEEKLEVFEIVKLLLNVP